RGRAAVAGRCGSTGGPLAGRVADGGGRPGRRRPRPGRRRAGRRGGGRVRPGRRLGPGAGGGVGPPARRPARVGPGRPPGDAAPGPVAVLALSAAQADLIRRLARDLPALPPGLTVTAPPAFRQREADTVVVSLVRSHAHRAVPYGDEPDWLPLALARCRRRLVLVGDPGTLARRAEWDGPLDHLDGAAARRERELVHHLVRYLHGRGRF